MAENKNPKNQRSRADKNSQIRLQRKEQRIFMATSRYNRIAPRKLNLVAALVRGMYIDEADTALKATPKRGAVVVLKALKSAVANATYYSRVNKINIDVPSLKIVKIIVNGGPTIKRVRPSSERRPYLIRKRFSHLFLELQEVKRVHEPSPKVAAVTKEQPQVQQPATAVAEETKEREVKQKKTVAKKTSSGKRKKKK